jgi:hypothetical protein
MFVAADCVSISLSGEQFTFVNEPKTNHGVLLVLFCVEKPTGILSSDLYSGVIAYPALFIFLSFDG